MLVLPPTTQATLPILSAVARLLASERSFAARIYDMFVLLRDAVQFHDGRLVCWLQSDQPASLREQFYTPNGLPHPWNDELTQHVVQRNAPVRLTAPLRVFLDGDAPELPGEITYYGAPIIWDGQLWGVLELRAAGAEAFGQSDQALLAALLPLLAAAIAVEGVGEPVRTMQRRSGELNRHHESLHQ